jgi:hypothetical protein
VKFSKIQGKNRITHGWKVSTGKYFPDIADVGGQQEGRVKTLIIIKVFIGQPRSYS